MNAFRNLYKVWSNGSVVAIITAANEVKALEVYALVGGKAADIRAERVSFGYPTDVCRIYC